MSLATLATLYGGVIEGAEAVKKSYPNYFSDISSLGIDIKYHENNQIN
jgi:5-enolpyruvylshikimate-3-phosphate synthase